MKNDTFLIYKTIYGTSTKKETALARVQDLANSIAGHQDTLELMKRLLQLGTGDKAVIEDIIITTKQLILDIKAEIDFITK